METSELRHFQMFLTNPPMALGLDSLNFGVHHDTTHCPSEVDISPETCCRKFSKSQRLVWEAFLRGDFHGAERYWKMALNPQNPNAGQRRRFGLRFEIRSEIELEELLRTNDTLQIAMQLALFVNGALSSALLSKIFLYHLYFADDATEFLKSVFGTGIEVKSDVFLYLMEIRQMIRIYREQRSTLEQVSQRKIRRVVNHIRYWVQMAENLRDEIVSEEIACYLADLLDAASGNEEFNSQEGIVTIRELISSFEDVQQSPLLTSVLGSDNVYTSSVKNIFVKREQQVASKIGFLCYCGAGVNKSDRSGRKAWEIALNEYPHTDALLQLLQNGLHLCPSLATTDDLEGVLSYFDDRGETWKMEMSLKCLAANVAAKLPFKTRRIPKSIQKFVEIH